MRTFFTLATAMLFVLSGPIALAAPNCEKNPYHPSCPDPGGGGGGTMTLINVNAQWGGLISESGIRHCDNTYGSAANGGVNYECAKTPVVTLGPLPTAGGGLCSLLENQWTLGGDSGQSMGISRLTAYGFMMDPTWNDTACIDESSECLVRMDLWAYFDQWCNDRGKCGRLVIFNAWGNAKAAGSGELNPFTQSQTIDIDDLIVTFKDIGKNRTVATCSYGATDLANTRFSTVPK
jgi:hypothetical protein